MSSKLFHSARVGILLAAIAWVAHTQTSAPAPLATKKLADDLYVIEGTSNGSADVGNVTIYVTEEGLILVDDRFDRDYEPILEAVKKISTKPVKYIVNTHHHGDHTGSNAKFLTSAELVAHSNARKHMIEGKMPGAPPITFSAEASVFLGGKEVRGIYMGKGHTDGDIAVYIPARKTVCLGDLMAGTRGVTNPVVDYSSGGSLGAWPETLDGVLKLDIETVVPGHGDVTNRAGLQAHRDKVQKIRDEVSGMVSKGQSKDAVQAILVSEFDFKPINLRALDNIILEFKR